MKPTAAMFALAAFAAPLSAPALAEHGGAALSADAQIVVAGSMLRPAVNNDSNKWWLDYRTDISEAKRELASDLRRATDDEDVREAWAEYYREVRDAQKDYSKEMAERGYRVVSFDEESFSVLALNR